jgi:hypothetical protein
MRFEAAIFAARAAVILRCEPLRASKDAGWNTFAAAILRDAAQERGSSG